MLLQRIITASILASLIVLAVFQLSLEFFSLLIGLVAMLGLWEWSRLVGIEALFKRGLLVSALLLPMIAIQFWTQILELIAQAVDWTDVRNYSGILEWFVIPPVMFWVLVMLLIRKTPAGVLKIEMKIGYKALIGWFLLLSTWMFLTRLRMFYGAEMTLYFLLLIWSADIAAYFTGKKFGKTKLSPEISPGKTVEGMYGALLIGVICAVTLSLTYGFTLSIASDFVLLSVLTVLLSVYGDLFFSVVKRQRGVKDSGSLLPGHGGILDRIDSLCAAAPFFYAGVYLIYRQVS